MNILPLCLGIEKEPGDDSESRRRGLGSQADGHVRSHLGDWKAMTHEDPPEDFGEQIVGSEDAHPWVTPLLFALAFATFFLMLLAGRAPWQ